MYQERVGSASSSSSRITSSFERSRVQSAPPSKHERRYPHKFNDQHQPLHKPMTPDPEYVSRVLQARISSALAGPEIRLSHMKNTTSLPDEETTVQTSSHKILYGRASMRRSAGLARTETANLVPIDDPEELAMLRSIGRSEYSFDTTTKKLNKLHIHEFEDKSDEDDSGLLQSTTSTIQRRRKSLVRQLEQDDSSNISKIRENAVSHMENRLSGFRHEKMRSSTRSGENEGIVQLAGLVYDADFDCYYNPEDDTYYRVNSVEKPIL